MRAWLFVLAVLATFKEIVQVASTDILEPDKLEQIENSLISIFGMEKRPKIIDRTNIVIPDELHDIYNRLTTGAPMDSVNLPMPGVHAKSANTMRSFQHEGNFLHCNFFIDFCRYLRIENYVLRQLENL